MTERIVGKGSIHGLVVSFAGIGYLPVMPGSWCTLVVALPALWLPNQFSIQMSMLALAILFSALSLISIPKIQASWGTDPSAVVIDEAVGMFLILATPFPYLSPLWLGVSVLVFRVYDVVKPWPINLINARTEAWSVLFDDVLAAVLSIATIAIIFAVFQSTIWFS